MCPYCKQRLFGLDLSRGAHLACNNAFVKQQRINYSLRRYAEGVFCNCCNVHIESEDYNAIVTQHTQSAKTWDNLIYIGQVDLCLACQKCVIDQIKFNNEICHPCCHMKNHRVTEIQAAYFVFAAPKYKLLIPEFFIPEFDFNSCQQTEEFTCHEIYLPLKSNIDRTRNYSSVPHLAAFSTAKECINCFIYNCRIQLSIAHQLYTLVEIIPQSPESDFSAIQKRLKNKYPRVIYDLLAPNYYELID